MTLAPEALARRVALVTGAGRIDGIGAAAARALAAAGAAVAVSDLTQPTAVDLPRGHERDDDGIEVVAEDLRRRGADALALVGDVSSEADCDALVRRTVSEFGSCDIVVNNAAAPHGLDRGPAANVPVEWFDLQLTVNLRGAFLVARAASEGMRERGWGRIVNVASIAGLRGSPERAAYSASKAGLVGLTYSLAAEFAPDGVTVNTVCPGVTLTARNLTTIRRGEVTGRSHSPMGRAGRPEDVAGAVTFFASDLAGFVTGQVLSVDGGLGMVLPDVS